MDIGFAIPRATAIDGTWTTIHLARAALRRGHRVLFIEPFDHEVDARGRSMIRAATFDSPQRDPEHMARTLRNRHARRVHLRLEQLDRLLIRAAPLDLSILTFAMLARERGVPVINDPGGAILVSHKAWLAAVPGAPCPRTIVTRRSGAAHVFYSAQPHGVIVKPARGSGGRGVGRVGPGRPDALDRAWADASARGDGYVVVQSYVPAAEEGEKRLVWLDGEVLGGYLRRRSTGEFRHNLKHGATAVPTQVTPTERALIARVSPALLAAGIRLAGLDLIGELLTEVNALNPGGVYHTDRLQGTHLADRIITAFEGPPRNESSRSPWALPVP